ncbi:MAG: XRE family transcriptional regulator [Bacteriovoracaceae bacterium]
MKKFPSDSELNRVRKKLKRRVGSKPLPSDAGPVEELKYRICEKFVIYLNSRKMTQKELAKLTGIDEALMSKILHYRFDEFTIDRLLKILMSLYQDITLNLYVA